MVISVRSLPVHQESAVRGTPMISPICQKSFATNLPVKNNTSVQVDCSQSPIFPWDFRDSYA